LLSVSTYELIQSHKIRQCAGKILVLGKIAWIFFGRRLRIKGATG